MHIIESSLSPTEKIGHAVGNFFQTTPGMMIAYGTGILIGGILLYKGLIKPELQRIWNGITGNRSRVYGALQS